MKLTIVPTNARGTRSCELLVPLSFFFYHWLQLTFSALSFLLTAGAFDKVIHKLSPNGNILIICIIEAAEWAQLSASERTAIKSQYNAAGIKLIVSLFGATDAPTSGGHDSIATADTMATWVRTFGLDGVNVDYEVTTTKPHSRMMTFVMPSRTSLLWMLEMAKLKYTSLI